ncbi:helix-hairpin-helix domain-containing protein [Cloacibacillus sp. An23]|uniref:helix-hairpin-helix domain-containing protein n=1 Tax=Cloacibacillus sp. An23 TaxID=1965591 RepID=UPI000B57CEF1|nr:helix-hairpin-helix domain-containing protein [Cloacibacillus sp. An23]OUO94849.1 hypothetical protein B5F39_02990 [Cloacibacillus sp. An23]
MNFRASGKVLTAAGIICFAAAFLLLNSFKGEFGKDTAGLSTELPQMEDTLDVTPKAAAPAAQEPERLASVTQSTALPQKWVVYVTGAVRNPGVYEIAPSSRVYEALNAAGGFSADADQEAVNLAAMLTDGVHIKFPRKGEAVTPQSSAPAAPARASVSSAPRASAASGKININTAGLGELDSLAGIGPKTGQAIIDYREANGPFRRVEDLMNVKGIGPKKFDAIKDDITVGG